MKSNFKRTHYSNQLDEQTIGERVKVGGWVEDLRDIGRIIFLIIRDITGPIQVVINYHDFPQVKEITRQSSILISGIVQNTIAKGIRVEIKLENIISIFPAQHPLPIDPTGRVESSIDKRIDSRALDLRNSNISRIFIIRSKVLEVLRKKLQDKHFIEVNTPKIIGSASEGGSNLFSFDYFKKKAFLAQSPQLYKEQLILALDRVFEIASYFRAENSNTVRHLTEFQSVDIEAAFVDYHEIMNIMEETIKNIIDELVKSTLLNVANHETIASILDSKFEELTYKDCIQELNLNGEKIEYGEDLSDSSLRKLGQLHPGFYFITEWPLKLKPFYIHEKEDDEFLSCSFDLQFGYLELISGGTRQHDPNKVRKRLQEQGLDPSNFSEHLKAFEWGMPPHSGCGLGLDRLLMVLTNSNNIREVVLYPRDPIRLMP